MVNFESYENGDKTFGEIDYLLWLLLIFDLFIFVSTHLNDDLDSIIEELNNLEFLVFNSID